MTCTQLIYASQPYGPDALTLASILTTARHNNRRDSVTGCSICRPDLFFQMPEGEAAIVEATDARIRRDPRHVDPIRLWLGEAPARLFAGWNMRHDPMRSWMWSRQEVEAGAVRRVAAEPVETAPL